MKWWQGRFMKSFLFFLFLIIGIKKCISSNNEIKITEDKKSNVILQNNQENLDSNLINKNVEDNISVTKSNQENKKINNTNYIISSNKAPNNFKTGDLKTKVDTYEKKSIYQEKNKIEVEEIINSNVTPSSNNNSSDENNKIFSKEKLEDLSEKILSTINEDESLSDNLINGIKTIFFNKSDSQHVENKVTQISNNTRKKSFDELKKEIPLENEIVFFEQGYNLEEKNKIYVQGVINVSKDSTPTAPKLDIIGEKFEKNNNISFYIYSNYFNFIEKGEILLYGDKQGRKEIGKISIPKPTLNQKYDLILDNKHQNYEIFYYKLRVYNSANKFDETSIKSLENKKINVDSMMTKEKSLADEIYDKSSLVIHHIPIDFTKLRFAGIGFDIDNKIFLDNKEITVDENGKFIYEGFYFPGTYKLEFKVYDEVEVLKTIIRTPEEIQSGNLDDGVDIEEMLDNSSKEVEKELHYLYSKFIDVTVEENYHFLVGIADFKYGKNHVEKSSDLLLKNSEYDEGTFNEGRLAFYTRNRFGKYKLTAQADTEGQEIKHIFDGLGRRDNREIFKDMSKEDKGYTFGDESYSIMDVDTQGQFYLRLEWDNNKALWGNYSTDINHGEYLNYSKSLYGAQFIGASQEITQEGENRYSGTVFYSNPETLSEYNIFLATGGSLYFLNQKDIVEGSEDVRIEVIDTKTGNKVKEESLSEGTDYSINNIQGRIILNEPLSQYSYKELGDVIKDKPITDYKTYLVVSYEYYEPSAVYSDDYSAGGSGKYWINDNIQIGAVTVQSRELDEKYELKGLNGVIRKTKNTYLEWEYAESEGNKIGKGLYSSTGGMSFKDVTYIDRDEDERIDNSGRAYGVSGVLSLNELSEKFTEGSMLKFWYRKKDGGFSVDSLDDGSTDTEYGFESDYIVNERLVLTTAFSTTESKDNEDTTKDKDFSVTANYAVNEKLGLAVEVRNSDGNNGSSSTNYNSHDSDNDDYDEEDDGSSVDVGVTATYKFSDKTTGYVGVQKAINTTKTDTNDMMVTLGGSTSLTEKIKASAEVSKGDEESGGTAQLSYLTSNNHEIYITTGQEQSKADGKSNEFTFGQKMLLSDKYEVYHENQFSKGTDNEKEITQVYGVNVNLTKKIRVGIGYEQGDNKEEDSKTKRQGVTTNFYYDDRKKLKFSNRLEVIKEKTSGEENEKTIEYLTVNDALYKLNDEWTAIGKVDFSITENKTKGGYDQKFMELGVGGAYRPIWNDRLNMLWKYSFIYDLNGHDEDDDYSFGDLDERSNIFSYDVVYSLTKKLDVGSKIAYKKAEMKAANDESEWFSAETTLYAINMSYNFYKNWRISGEYHWLISNSDGERKEGAIAGIDYDIHKNLRVGIGYNFTDFSDDLRYDDYKARGVYINIIGKF